MTESRKCSRCGAELPADAPGGHCLPCLLQLGLASGETSAEKVAADIVPASEGGTLPPGSSLAEKPGDRIGHYKLLQQIGEGGCGIVYMAEQEEPVRRRVALKIIKLGMDTRNVIARFEAERQALALMDHPNIARVLDAGATPAGRPYFVMELVRGVKITTYCDQQRLSTRQRLDLFIQVCQAVQHAHQKGIIHRDLKPSNILVTEQDGAPMPKIIDFGIAKATGDQRLTDKTLFTAFEQFIGTPAYMSPEQAGLGGLDIDTRSDIYSLGVLLYELLTGQPPFDAAQFARSALDEILRVIREKEPPRPSARLTTLTEQELTTVAQRHQIESTRLPNLLRGDLDWIVMKALEKDRTRRYETANGFARDLQRFLDNEAVVARPPGNLYRFQKLVRRNKLAFTAVGAVILALLLGLGISTWEFLQQRQARHRAVAAEREQTRLRYQAETEAAKSQQVAQFLQDMLRGAAPTRALGRDTTILKEILDDAAKRMGAELTNQPEIEIELRGILVDVYGQLGLSREQQHTARESLEIAHSRFAGNSAPMSEALCQMAIAFDSEAAARESVAMRRKLLAAEPVELSSSSGARTVNGPNLHLSGPVTPGDLYNSLAALADILYKEKQFSEAEIAHREALSLARKWRGDEHRDVATQLNQLGLTLREEGHLPESEASLRAALAMYRKLYGGDSHPDIGVTLNDLALVLKSRGRLSDAEALFRESLELTKKMFGPEHTNVGLCLYNLAGLAELQNRLADAESLGRSALTIARSPGKDEWFLALILNGLGGTLRAEGKLEEARQLLSEALVLRRKVFGSDHLGVADSLANLAYTLELLGRAAEAEPLCRECLAIRERKFPEHWQVFQARSLLGASLTAQRKYAEAEPLLISGCEGIQQRLSKIVTGEGKVRLREALQRLVQFYEATGRPNQTIEWKKKLAQLDQPETVTGPVETTGSLGQ